MKRKEEMKTWPCAVAAALALTLLVPHGAMARASGDASVSSSSGTATSWLVAQRGGGEGPQEVFMEVLPPGQEGQRGRGAPSPPPEAPRPPSGAMMPATPAVPLPAEPRFQGQEVEIEPQAASPPVGIVKVPRGAIPKAGPEMLPVPPSTPQGSPGRPGYFTGKLLNEQDFKKEQNYVGQSNPIGALYESLRAPPAGPAAPPPGAPKPPLGSEKMMEGLLRDLAQNQPLVEPFARLGAPPTPEGLGRMVGLAGRYPEEFRELAARTAKASRDPAALGEVEEALQAFFSKGGVRPGEWGELGYVVARLIQEDKAEPNKGQPIFQKPLLVNQDVEPPKGKDEGKGMDDWFKDLEGGDVSDLFPGVEDLDKTLEGRGKDVSWGDGIQGMTDQEGKPDADLPSGGVPRVPLDDPFEKGTVPGPGAGGAKEPYGGLNINVARMGQSSRDKSGGQPVITGKVTHLPAPPGSSEGNKQTGRDKEKDKSGGRTGDKSKSKDSSGKPTEDWYSPNMRKITYPSGDYIWSFRLSNGTVLHMEYDKNGNLQSVVTHYKKGSGGMVGPEGEGGDTPPVHEPQLLMRAEKEGVGQEKESHAVPITDPMPVRGALSAEGTPSGGESSMGGGPSGSQGTEQKWKFAGKKPGSEVTDYGVFGGPPGKPELNVKRDLSQVTDPAEYERAPAGKEALASPAVMRQQAASALAPVFAQLLVNSVQQAGEAQQSSQAAQADAAGAEETPSGPAPEGPPPTGGGGGPSN